jgi:hypothetical protein
LYLALEGVVDALALGGMVITLRAADILHNHVGTQRHTLVNVPSRGKRISPLLLRVVTSVRAGVRARVRAVLPRLLHRG